MKRTNLDKDNSRQEKMEKAILNRKNKNDHFEKEISGKNKSGKDKSEKGQLRKGTIWKRTNLRGEN